MPLFSRPSSNPTSLPQITHLKPISESQPEMEAESETRRVQMASKGKNPAYTTEGKPVVAGRCLPKVSAREISTPAPVVCGSPVEQARVAKLLKEAEERDAWCERFDAAQPSGRTLGVNDSGFHELLGAFRKEMDEKKKMKEEEEKRREEEKAKKKKKKAKESEIQEGEEKGKKWYRRFRA